MHLGFVGFRFDFRMLQTSKEIQKRSWSHTLLNFQETDAQHASQNTACRINKRHLAGSQAGAKLTEQPSQNTLLI